MKDRTRYEYVWIDGNKYPMTFSMLASMEIAEVCGDNTGDIEQFAKMMKDPEVPLSKKMHAMSAVVAAMILAGCEYLNETRPGFSYPGAPLSEDGRFVPISAYQIEVRTAISDMDDMLKAITKCANKGTRKEIGSKPVKTSKKKK